VRIQDTGARVANMSGGQRQGIAICRAVTWAKTVVFHGRADGSARRRPDAQRARPDQARARARLSVVLISHNMPEVFEVADRIEVLRLGARVARLRPKEVSMEDAVAGHDRRADVPRGRRGGDVMTTAETRDELVEDVELPRQPLWKRIVTNSNASIALILLG
jgi:simple sugar transport system ATP-binding protein